MVRNHAAEEFRMYRLFVIAHPRLNCMRDDTMHNKEAHFPETLRINSLAATNAG